MGEWYEKQTIGLLPEGAARRWGPREALAFKGRRWTFAEQSARVDAMAKGLLAFGISPGDKVALWMVNRPEWIDAMFAVMNKIPRHVVFVEEFPMTSSGKIQKVKLRERARSELPGLDPDAGGGARALAPANARTEYRR